MLAEKEENLKMMWVPAHTGYKGNEALNDAAKDASNEDILPGTKATEMDLNVEKLMRNTMNKKRKEMNKKRSTWRQ
jgi:ribonuclease HI